MVTSLRSANVSSYAIDRNTGTLSPVGVTSSGGAGPSDAAITDDGFVVVPNQDANNVGVVKVDPTSGLLTLVGSVRAGMAPAVVKVAGREALVGHARSNDVHHMRIDPTSGLLTLVGSTTLGERVTSVDVAPGGQRWAVGTISGQVYIYEIVGNQLTRRWSGPTGGDLWDLAFSDPNTLYTVGVTSNRVAAFDLSAGNFRQTAAWTIPGERSTRSIIIVPGVGKTFLIVSEFNGNRTWVLSATP